MEIDQDISDRTAKLMNRIRDLAFERNHDFVTVYDLQVYEGSV